MKFETIETDTGIKSSLLRAYIDSFGAYLNIEVPNHDAEYHAIEGAEWMEPFPQQEVAVNLAVNYSGKKEDRQEALSRLFHASELFENALHFTDYGKKAFHEEDDYHDGSDFVEYVYDLSFDGSPQSLKRLLDQISSVVDEVGSRDIRSSQLEQIL